MWDEGGRPRAGRGLLVNRFGEGLRTAELLRHHLYIDREEQSVLLLFFRNTERSLQQIYSVLDRLHPVLR